jgi:hypothetical protein
MKPMGRQMRLLETLQQYDFDIEYYPGAKNYIQDTHSRRVDFRNPPVPQVGRKTIVKTIDDWIVNVAHAEVLLSSSNQANRWFNNIQVDYGKYLYFEGVLRVLEGKDMPESEPGAKSLAR